MTELFDAHLHLWDPTARHHDWLAAHPSLRRRFGPEDLDAGAHELIGAVFVQANCRDDEALDEVRWVADMARDHSLIRGIVAYAPLHRGRAAEPGLAAVAAEPLVVGVRWLLQGRPRDEITGRALISGLRSKLSGAGDRGRTRMSRRGRAPLHRARPAGVRPGAVHDRQRLAGCDPRGDGRAVV